MDYPARPVHDLLEQLAYLVEAEGAVWWWSFYWPAGTTVGKFQWSATKAHAERLVKDWRSAGAPNIHFGAGLIGPSATKPQPPAGFSEDPSSARDVIPAPPAPKPSQRRGKTLHKGVIAYRGVMIYQRARAGTSDAFRIQLPPGAHEVSTRFADSKRSHGMTFTKQRTAMEFVDKFYEQAPSDELTLTKALEATDPDDYSHLAFDE